MKNPKDQKEQELKGFHLYIQLKNNKQLSTDKLFLLLKEIEREGSISKAAEKLNLSYRYSWGLIRDTEQLLSVSLLDKKVGGSEGGGAVLTDLAQELLCHYEKIKQAVEKQLGDLLDPGRGPMKSVMEEGSREKSSAGDVNVLFMASTMEPVETGLLEVLEQVYYQKTGVIIRHMGVGTGKALKIAKAGRVDLVLVHSPQMEKEFMEEGYGAYRKEVMTNRYYLVGPLSDPARLSTVDKNSQMGDYFRRIAEKETFFVSRSDQSGTHIKENEFWEQSGIDVKDRKILTDNSLSSNLKSLEMAFEHDAYTLTDSTSFQMSQYKGKLKVFAGEESSEGPFVTNRFSVIVVDPQHTMSNQYVEAVRFTDWLIGEEGQRIIGSFPANKKEDPYFESVK